MAQGARSVARDVFQSFVTDHSRPCVDLAIDPDRPTAVPVGARRTPPASSLGRSRRLAPSSSGPERKLGTSSRVSHRRLGHPRVGRSSGPAPPGPSAVDPATARSWVQSAYAEPRAWYHPSLRSHCAGPEDGQTLPRGLPRGFDRSARGFPVRPPAAGARRRSRPPVGYGKSWMNPRRGCILTCGIVPSPFLLPAYSKDQQVWSIDACRFARLQKVQGDANCVSRLTKARGSKPSRIRHACRPERLAARLLTLNLPTVRMRCSANPRC